MGFLFAIGFSINAVGYCLSLSEPYSDAFCKLYAFYYLIYSGVALVLGALIGWIVGAVKARKAKQSEFVQP